MVLGYHTSKEKKSLPCEGQLRVTTGVGVCRDLPLVGWCVAHAVSLSCGEVVTSEYT